MKKTMKKTLALILSLIMVVSCFSGIITGVQATGVSPIAGDINGDGSVNNKDLTRLMKYIAGEDVVVVTVAIDPNGDGSVNNKDLTRLMRYISGDDIGIVLSGCNHEKEKIAAVEATCTKEGNIAYWYCADCDKYFSDAEGVVEIALEDTVIERLPHTEETILGYPATMTETGLTDGAKCNVCGTIIKEQEIIPISEFEIVYNIYGNDTYLENLYLNGEIENSNPVSYSSEIGLTKFKNLNVPGYVFEGWYDAPGSNGEVVKSIPAGTTGEIEVYAKWTLVEYKIYFDSPDLPVESIKYTVDTGVPLINPAKQFGYTFVGWSNDDGFLISRITPGTTGNITLHANWTSNRNKATSYSNYEKPIIIEDDTNGQFFFVYDIGKIDNVPLNQIAYLGNSDGIEINQEYDVSNSVSEETAKQVANTVANATTKSSGWTLSDEWETVFAAGNEIDEQKGKTQVRTDSEGNITGGNYFVSNSSGGSSFVSNSSGGSNSSTSKVTTDNSYGINRSYDNSNEAYIDAKLGVSNTTTVGAEVSVDIPCTPVEVGASIENSTTVSSEVAGGLRNSNSVHVDDSRSSYIGTYNENNSSSYYNSTIENSSTWNSTSGYEKSYQTSRNTELSNAISEQISKKTSYNVTDATSGSKSTNASDSYTNSNSEEYSSSVRYNSEEKTTSKQSFKYSSSEQGYYRLVNAGTVHVFAVVGYDVATSSYFTYTYNVLDDERHIYTDFSLSDPNFNDCENGVVTFEIPYEVNEYVAGLTGKSAGLQFGLDGIVTKYTTDKGGSTVVVPQYYSANNTDNSYTAVKVTKISADAFKGNTNIKTVVLPLYVTEIPDGAFENCTNLETVIAYGVTKIGANAFKGCTNLKSFAIDNKVTSLGTNAFDGVNEIMVNAANVNVADNAILSGANKVTLSIAKMDGSFDNKVVSISEEFDYFALYGNGSQINNLQIVSNAKETVINNMILSGNKDTPLKLNSEKVTLNRVTIKDAPGFAIISTSPKAIFNLYSVNTISSASENAILCREIELSIANEEVASSLNVSGNILNCGTIKDPDTLLKMTSGNLKTITEDEFNAYLTSSKVTFDANGGTVSETTKTVYYGQLYGALPTSTRANYTFAGWYTAKEGGTQITADTTVTALVNQTLYAHWAPNKFTLTYNANGGTVSTGSKTLTFGDSYGTLPTPTRANYTFAGWYTAISGGTQVSASTKPTTATNVTIYAHWTPNKFTLTYNANGGTVSPVSKTLTFGDSYGTLPTPTKDHHNFLGWYTAASGGTKVSASTTPTSATNATIYAHWEQKPVSGWVKASEMPSGAQVVETKWTYTLREYTSNSASSLSGWTKYDSKRTSWGSWSGWSTTNPSNGVRNVESRTEYHYYRWIKGNYVYTYQYDSTYKLEELWSETELPKSTKGDTFYEMRYKGTDTYANRWVMASYAGNRSVDKTFTRTTYRYQEPIYTYYYYRDLSKEATSDPTGQTNVSNVVKWVKYRAK